MFGALAPALTVAQVGPTPEASAQLIAQGVDRLPRGKLTWRVIDSVATPGDTAEFGERSLAFAYATDGEFLVTSLTTGQNVLLNPGQAHFSTAGSAERRASTGNEDQPYLSIELVTEEAATAPGSDESSSLLFRGDPFDSPRGDHNLQLTRGVALPEEETTFEPANDLPYLLIVLDGAIQTTAADNQVTELEAGTFTEYTGDIELLASATEGGSWLIASVGSEVEIPPIPTQEATGATGTLVIELESCPDGFDNPCAPATNKEVTVPAFHHVDDENWLIPDRAEWSDDRTTFTYPDLPVGRYTTGPSEDTTDVENLEGARWSDDLSGWTFRIREDRTTTLRLQVIPPDSGDTGEFNVELYDCPAGTDPTVDDSDCTITSQPWDFTIAPKANNTVDTVIFFSEAAIEEDDGSWTFPDAPAGTPVVLNADPDGDGPDQVFVTGDVVDGIEGTWEFEVSANDTAHASIYRITASESVGTLVVTLFDCPADTSPDTEFAGCTGAAGNEWNVGVSLVGQGSVTRWTLEDDAEAIPDSRWMFEDLPATTLELSPGGFQPGDYTTYVQGIDVSQITDDTWSITIPSNDLLEINIFRVPNSQGDVPPANQGGTGSLVIAQYDCPWDTDVELDVSLCVTSTEVWEVTITNQATGEMWSMLGHGSQYDSGTWVFESLPAGTYTITPFTDDAWAVSYPGTIEVSADDETYIEIYSVPLTGP